MTYNDAILFPLLIQWHALSREEQAKYYELARKERQLHMQLYPGWSARDNYAVHGKKKKKKKDKNQGDNSGLLDCTLCISVLSIVLFVPFIPVLLFYLYLK